VVASQIDVHTQYGGVVPEVASRIHVENISIVIQQCLAKSGMSMDDIAAIAFTQGPGLIGSLHVGVMAAKTMAWMYQKPLVPVQHLTGHIYANAFVGTLQFPLLALVISGGHTELVLMKKDYDFEVIGTTQDDAIGEAYDKVARVLGLGYPGGPIIDKLAKQGQPQYKLPRTHTDNPLNFSFSGLKSAVLQAMKRTEKAGETVIVPDMCASFQETALKDLWQRVEAALEQYDVKQVVLAGGVAANSRLREMATTKMAHHPDISLIIPPLAYCTDNAAMIGASGYIAYQLGRRCDIDVGADAGLEM
jgi:N6-L-threonylcarbamoyladenine synthase